MKLSKALQNLDDVYIDDIHVSEHVERLENRIKELEGLVLPKSEMDSLIYKMSPQQSRLFIYLVEHKKAQTHEIQASCRVGNVSDVAAGINRRLKLNNDPRIIICSVKYGVNDLNESQMISTWHLKESSSKTKKGE